MKEASTSTQPGYNLMKTWIQRLGLRLGLSLMIAIGVWPSRLPAQAVPRPALAPSLQPSLQPAPYGPATYLPYAPQVLVAPAVPYEPAHHVPLPAAYAWPVAPEPAEHRLGRLMNHFGVGCQANPDGACSSLGYELRFVFGSCRSFFRESCEPCSAKRSAP